MPCLLVDVVDAGDPLLTSLGAAIDIRTDVPRYNVYRDGRLTDSPKDILQYWADDLVAFALGCSFTFERALEEIGVPMRHILKNRRQCQCSVLGSRRSRRENSRPCWSSACGRSQVNKWKPSRSRAENTHSPMDRCFTWATPERLE